MSFPTPLRRLFLFLAKLYQYRNVIWAMAARDLAARYVGTFGGIFWAMLHPLAMVLIYWFVFSVGFKAQGPAGMPFILYFVSGLVPWLFLNEVVTGGINAVTTNAQLVKKTVFPAEILPLVNLTSATFTHVCLFATLCFLAWKYGYGPSLTTIQVVYFYAALASFAVGLSWLFGSLQVFHRDLGQAITVVLSLWFWLTPIVWSTEIIPERYRSVLQYNPVYYLVQGYRASVLSVPSIWIGWSDALRFWMIAGPILVLGGYVFRRLKPEFADVL